MRKCIGTAVLFVLFCTGCESLGIGQAHGIDGGSDYNLNGKEITPPNQVRVDNPYSFPVNVTWQKNKTIILAPHSQKLILFEGMTEPGPITVWKNDEKGARVDLKYIQKGGGL